MRTVKQAVPRLALIAAVFVATSVAATSIVSISVMPLRAQSEIAPPDAPLTKQPAPAKPPALPKQPASTAQPPLTTQPALTTMLAETPEELPLQLLNVKRIFVDRLTGGETAAQMRDLVISSLQGSKLFILTENEGRADAFLRGAAEDLIYVDSFQSSDGINAHVGSGENDSVGTSTRFNGAGGGASRSSGRNINATIGDHESVSEKERKHEALATVRIVNKDGDVIWTTTQESNGAKFRGASADVAEKITRQLVDDVAKLRKAGPMPRH